MLQSKRHIIFVLPFVHQQPNIKMNGLNTHTLTHCKDIVPSFDVYIFVVCVRFKDDISSLWVHNEIKECIQHLNKEQIENIKWANPRIIFLFLIFSSLLFGMFILIFLYRVSLDVIILFLFFLPCNRDSLITCVYKHTQVRRSFFEISCYVGNTVAVRTHKYHSLWRCRQQRIY